MTRFIKLSEDDFVTIFKPVSNHIAESSPFDWGDGFGTMFETYGNEHDFVIAQDAELIWTLCSGEENDHIISGYHVVDRIGYFVTENPVPAGIEYRITLPNVDEDDTGADAIQCIDQPKSHENQLEGKTLNDEVSRIAELNDLCRNAMGVAGKLVQTHGINMLSPEEQSAIREKVENFNDFPEDNDPYRERDFGAFDHNGKRVFWKIDYYALDLTHGSEDPADPSQTVRVLTIMLAEEY